MTPTDPTDARPDGQADAAWRWPDDWSARSTTDLARQLELAAEALRDGRATVRRSATSTSSSGPNELDVELTWTPADRV